MAKIYTAPKKIKLMKSIVYDKLSKKAQHSILHKSKSPTFKTSFTTRKSPTNKKLLSQKINYYAKAFKNRASKVGKVTYSKTVTGGNISSFNFPSLPPVSIPRSSEKNVEDSGAESLKSTVSKIQTAVVYGAKNVSGLKTSSPKADNVVNNNSAAKAAALKKKAIDKFKAAQAAKKKKKSVKKLINNKKSKLGFLGGSIKLMIILALGLIALIAYTAMSSAVILTGVFQGAAGWLLQDEGEEKTNEELKKKAQEYEQLCVEVLTDKRGKAAALLDEAVDDDYIALNSHSYYPASAYKSIVEQKIYTEDIDIADLIAVLYVKLQKEKGIENDNNEIYDIKLTKEDIEDFLGKVNESPKYLNFKKSYQSGLACPGQNCKKEYRNDRCAYYYTDEGYIRYYCAGHPYCDNHHNMVSITFEKNESIMDELNFTDDDKERVNLIMNMIKTLIES